MKTSILKTEADISFVKQTFSQHLSQQLKLTQVSAPIAVLASTGINDNLNGIERCVNFPIKFLADQKAVVVNSLAKWKRLRLKQLNVEAGQGILTDMKAIRPDEDYSPIHSIYVDQWDWEKHLDLKNRNLESLKQEVSKIYESLKFTEKKIAERLEDISAILPEKITFIHSEELLQKYPDKSPKEREHAICKEHKAVFIIGIGGELSHGEIHDGRAPDYDDWTSANSDGYKGLNGDILVWNPILESSFELSSMGIRVSPEVLIEQLKVRKEMHRLELPFHKHLANKELPQSLGGGIGQSRLCMFLLRKQHIGEVQASLWPEEVQKDCLEKGIQLL